MTHPRFRIALALVTLAAALGAVPREAGAQAFSPGDLTRFHAGYNTLAECDRCHGGGGGNAVSSAKCLSCHKELKKRIDGRRGYHGAKIVRSRPCADCHKEHRGASAALVPWPGGDPARFDHRAAGWPLEGAHQKLACPKCHDPKRLQDPAVTAHLTTNAGARTYLGLERECRACHFDEHRGALGAACAKCHDGQAWKPAPKFSHDKAWRLEGAHARVGCAGCHPKKKDDRPSAPPKAAKGAVYLDFGPKPHGTCTDCHSDPHSDRFGSDCRGCHTLESWAVAATKTTEPGFHDKTAFPLKGRHRGVSCARCHRRGADGKTILKPIAHDRCGRCHPSGHPDVPRDEMARRDCSSCHTEQGYAPSRFTAEMHNKTRFPLRDAHAAVACPACHVGKFGTPAAEKKAAPPPAGYLASSVVSKWRLRAPAVKTDTCAACHDSPHRDQLEGKACPTCHIATTWRIGREAFDHAAGTAFPLRGRHRDVPCERCHPRERDERGEFTRYRSLPYGDCTPCHGDVHYGQFEKLEPPLRCGACHDEEGFAPSRFDHGDAGLSDFPLQGEHAAVPCGRCHQRVALTAGASVVRYRPTPKECATCHEDFHGDAYREAARLLSPGRGATIDDGMPELPAAPWSAPEGWGGPPVGERTDCAACHAETGWPDVSFDHAATGFPLRGLHRKVSCAQCHGREATRGLSTECAGCHRDAHRGTLGLGCEECHTEEGFNRAPGVFVRHNRTGFPLVGRHAAVPCTECHKDVRNQGFDRAPTACVACHRADIPATGRALVDHGGLPTSCEACHTPVSFKIASFTGHDRCFHIGATATHGTVKCKSCHTGALPSSLGTCDGGSFSCTRCHGCETATHKGVSGYECKERACYRCHRGA